MSLWWDKLPDGHKHGVIECLKYLCEEAGLDADSAETILQTKFPYWNHMEAVHHVDYLLETHAVPSRDVAWEKVLKELKGIFKPTG